MEHRDFDEFYAAVYPTLVIEIYAYVGNLAEAQEIVQDAFVRAWTHWRRIGSYDSPRAWVAKTAYRLAISRWRRARTAAVNLLHLTPSRAADPDPTLSIALTEALSRLPHAQRRAVILHHLVGYSVQEVAALESAPASTVKSRLIRARQTLAAVLTETHAPAPADHDRPLIE